MKWKSREQLDKNVQYPHYSLVSIYSETSFKEDLLNGKKALLITEQLIVT